MANKSVSIAQWLGALVRTGRALCAAPVVVLAVSFLALTIPIVTANAVRAAEGGPVKVTADEFVISEGENLATFTGNVVVVQGTLTVRAQKLIVHYGAKGASDIETLEALGKVHIKTPEQDVTGDKGIYDPKTRVMRVVGNVRATSATGTVTAPELLVNFATNTTQFTNSTGSRVTGVFNP